MRNGITAVLSELELTWFVTVGAGCMDLPAMNAARNAATGLEDAPVQDIEVRVRGALTDSRRRDERYTTKQHHELIGSSLREVPNTDQYADADEISGCTVEGTHLTERFDIAGETGETLFSGCCGVGLNRLAIAFLYAHGFEPKAWPDAVASRLRGQQTAAIHPPAADAALPRLVRR